jgi:hypothetical protein
VSEQRGVELRGLLPEDQARISKEVSLYVSIAKTVAERDYASGYRAVIVPTLIIAVALARLSDIATDMSDELGFLGERAAEIDGDLQNIVS